MNVQAIPPGYHSVTPYLIVDGAVQAIEFYRQAFDATELMRLPMPNGKLGHAEIKIGDSIVMLADESPESLARSARSLGGSPIHILLYVKDVDSLFEQAVAAGGRVLRPLRDRFMATAPPRSKIRSASPGRSPRIPKMWRRRKCSGVSQRWASRAHDSHGEPPARQAMFGGGHE